MQIDRINGLVGSIAVKVPCQAATTANITLSGTQTVDGVALVSNDRCLVKNQTNASENGIYDVSGTDWSLSLDFNGIRDIGQGTCVRIISGTVSGQYFYEVTTEDPLIGTTDLNFALVNFPNTTSSYISTLLDDETAAEARATLGAAQSGTNTDITSLADGTTATTQSSGDNSTKLATTEFAEAAAAAAAAAVVVLNTKVIDIGDWNMDADNTVAVAHGLTLANIRTVSAMIRNDGSGTYYPIGYSGSSLNSEPQVYFNAISSTTVTLGRLSTGDFDNTSFDSTSFNRGWITIQYTD